MQSWLEGRNWEGTCAQATGMTASLRILSGKADSNTWESFTRSELKLESVHQESTCSDIFRKRATKPLQKQKHRQKYLTRTKEKKNWTVAQWSKVLFSDESKFCISFGNQGPRVWRNSGEKHNPCCLKSSVKFPQSVMIWAAMTSAGVGPLCFLKSTVNTAIYQDILEHFMLPSADKLYGDADFVFQQDLAPAHTAKVTKSWFNDHGANCAWLASKLVWPEPHREYMLNLCVLVQFSNTSLLQNQSLQCSDTCLKIPMGGMNGKILSRPLKRVNGNCCTLYSTMSKLLFSITMKVNGDIFDKQEFQWIFKFLTQSYYTSIIIGKTFF